MSRLQPIIMCGGAGARLWPASCNHSPKQFLSLTAALRSFQQTVRRFEGLNAEPILVVAGVQHQVAPQSQLAEIGVGALLLLEPEARDSAPAMAAAAVWMETRNAGGIAMFVASDHHLPDTRAFHRALLTAAGIATVGDIVTLGLRPTSAATGYGYIRPGEPQGEVLRRCALSKNPTPTPPAATSKKV